MRAPKSIIATSLVCVGLVSIPGTITHQLLGDIDWLFALPLVTAGEWRLAGCTLVVTLEPCTMCAGAIVLSRLDRLVFGAFDPKAGAVGSLWDVVRDRRLNHRPEVVPGVLRDECSALLDDFFAHQRLG